MVQNIAIKLTKKYFEERMQNTILKKLNKLLESTKKTTQLNQQNNTWKVKNLTEIEITHSHTHAKNRNSGSAEFNE